MNRTLDTLVAPLRSLVTLIQRARNTSVPRQRMYNRYIFSVLLSSSKAAQLSKDLKDLGERYPFAIATHHAREEVVEVDIPPRLISDLPEDRLPHGRRLYTHQTVIAEFRATLGALGYTIGNEREEPFYGLGPL